MKVTWALLVRSLSICDGRATSAINGAAARCACGALGDGGGGGCLPGRMLAQWKVRRRCMQMVGIHALSLGLLPGCARAAHCMLTAHCSLTS